MKPDISASACLSSPFRGLMLTVIQTLVGLPRAAKLMPVFDELCLLQIACRNELAADPWESCYASQITCEEGLKKK